MRIVISHNRLTVAVYELHYDESRDEAVEFVFEMTREEFQETWQMSPEEFQVLLLNAQSSNSKGQ